MNSFNIDETRALTELKDDLRELLGSNLVKLVLFGSRVRGDYVEESDIDIAILVKTLPRSLKLAVLDRIAQIELKHLVPLSVVVFSDAQFTDLKSRERRIALDIEREGTLL